MNQTHVVVLVLANYFSPVTLLLSLPLQPGDGHPEGAAQDGRPAGGAHDPGEAEGHLHAGLEARVAGTQEPPGPRGEWGSADPLGSAPYFGSDAQV